MSLVMTLYVTVILSGVITLVVGVNEIIRFAWFSTALVLAIYGSLVLAFGVYKGFAAKISFVDDALLEITTDR